MKNNTQKRLALILEAQDYTRKMEKGSVFVTDFKAMHLIERLLKEMQDMLAENLKLQAAVKYDNAWKKTKKDLDK